MTVHILVQCSKSKSVEPSQSLIWDNEMDHELWNKNWTSSSNRIEVHHLYTGRAIKNERELISSQVDFNGYVISAGAGLVAFDDTIPSYEATFFADDGPDYQNWSTLPNGGLKNLQINDDDVIVTFAAPIYHRALLADPEFDRLASNFIVAHTSPLAKHPNVKTVQIHPRTAEYLGVAFVDLNARLLQIFVEHGIKGFDDVFVACQNLQPMIERRPVTDEELFVIIESLESISSVSKVVRHLRHELGVKASQERIREVVFKIRERVSSVSEDGVSKFLK